jgi:hypothetical protein
MDEPEFHAEPAAATLCRKHVALRPVAITFFEYEGGEFLAEDQLAGKHPTDAEFVTVKTLKRVACPAS